MAADRDGALLAHIADTETEMRAEQNAMRAVLARLVETATAQSEMLSEILAAARQEPGPSEAAGTLRTLVSAVQENTEAVTVMANQMAALPAEIGTEVLEALGGEAEPPDET